MGKILTSHVGSLPRSSEVVDFIFAREKGKEFVQAAFDDCMTRSVSETVTVSYTHLTLPTTPYV